MEETDHAVNAVLATIQLAFHLRLTSLSELLEIQVVLLVNRYLPYGHLFGLIR